MKAGPPADKLIMNSYQNLTKPNLTSESEGLPGWTYFSPGLFGLELEVLFYSHWQFVCHVNEIKQPGEFVSYDIGTERGVVIRDSANRIHAFHNLCRHRGSRVVSGKRGQCNKVLVCPFHGWTYNLDGTLRGIARRDTFAEVDHSNLGLKRIEFEIWNGLVFIRFKLGKQASIAEIMTRHANEIQPYGLDHMIASPKGRITDRIEANWKAVRDVDNEGYHVPQAHPALNDLYGKDYQDEPMKGETNRSVGRFTPGPRKHWSVRHYLNILPENTHLPESHRNIWLYIGIFPNLVLGFYPDCVIFYQEIPQTPTLTLQRGGIFHHRKETREMKLARYLSGRIDKETSKEDSMLSVWVSEATKSSAYDNVIFSGLEKGVPSYHDVLREKLPVTKLDVEPATPELQDLNNKMLNASFG